ncbi:hypothetical protein TK90_2688 (plasmid) [Thioalkalivibrio sp. K90mix]|uniref:hypothetical protein n=1 Tax=Thioalkalivibrio sp. (strain K90mix) TaxID=396595 RepID=UPI000195A441|nr:hypothetical protein [Thioalkalivibrio sp. K90mix]ADC73174.1 hypothetical protein TK90_2688 [Thioalkalivibrio sp. K90mix]
MTRHTPPSDGIPTTIPSALRQVFSYRPQFALEKILLGVIVLISILVALMEEHGAVLGLVFVWSFWVSAAMNPQARWTSSISPWRHFGRLLFYVVWLGGVTALLALYRLVGLVSA